MTFKNTLLAAFAVLSMTNAHIIMKTPTPYSADTIDNSPISASGFPCKAQNGFKVSEQNKMAVGEKQTLSFTGSAVHNGGTCQLSVALGQQPDGSTPFKVIKTIEGGCPGTNAGTKEFSFELPDSIPDGEHTFAWTWMPTSSGQPEYYMNCAPIEVTGGASDESNFSQLPDMLVANLPELTDCTQTVNTILKVPNPGDVVEHADDTGREIAPPTGNCGAASGGGEKRSSSLPEGQQPTAAPSSIAPTPSSVLVSATAAPSASSIVIPSNPGGIFAPSASSAAGGAGPSTTTTLITVTGTPAGSAGPTAPMVSPSVAPSATVDPSVSAGPTAPINTAPTAPQPTQQPTNGNKGSATCTVPGSVVCNGPTQFGLCNHGTVVWQPVAPGTTCNDGVIQKREYRGRIVRTRI